MDRALAYLTLIISFAVWLIQERRNLTYSKVIELLIAGYIFSCTFPRLQMPIYTLPYHSPWGTFGLNVRFEPFLVLFFLFIAILGRQLGWQIQRPNIKVICGFIIFSLYVIFNPFNVVTMASLLPLSFVLIYFIFLEGMAQTISLRTIVNGIYRGFVYAVVLNVILAILFPVMGIRPAAGLYFTMATVRASARAGAVGTFAHPNNLAVFFSYVYVFFLACYLAGFKKDSSKRWSVVAFLVVFLSGSRSALAAIVVSSVMMVILYTYRQHSIFSPSVLLKVILPTTTIVALLLAFTPLNDMFFGSDVDAQVVNRGAHYVSGIAIFQEHPVLGVGLNSHLKYLNDNIEIDFNDYFDSYTGYDLTEEFAFNAPIHNCWLVLLCETGLIGMAFFVFYIVRYFVKFKPRIRKSKSKYYTIVLIAALGVFINFIIHGNTDFAPLTMQELNISLLLIFLAARDEYGTHLEDENTVYRTRLM